MQPTPTPTYKKLLLPGLIIIGLILAGTLLFMNGGVVNQGASLFKGVSTINVNTSVCKITVGPNGLPSKPTPSVKVISPNGGETYQAGQQITVKWSSCGIPSTELIRINLQDIVGNTVAGWTDTQNDGSETLTVHSPVFINGTTPIFPNMIFGNRYKVAISITNPTPAMQPMDVSDTTFTINSGGPIGTNCLEDNPRRFGLIEDELALATTTHPNNGNPNIANLGDFKIDPTETASICILKGINVFASANPIAPLSSVRIVDVATNQVIGSIGSFNAPAQPGESWAATIPVNVAYSLDPGKRFRIEGVMRPQPLAGTTNMLTLGITGFKAGANSKNISTVMDLYSRVMSLQ